MYKIHFFPPYYIDANIQTQIHIHMFCDYKDIFGKPREGVHAYRVFDVAIVDVLMTIFAALFISSRTGKPVAPILFVLFLMAILAHRMFCVRTTIDSVLFSSG